MMQRTKKVRVANNQELMARLSKVNMVPHLSKAVMVNLKQGMVNNTAHLASNKADMVSHLQVKADTDSSNQEDMASSSSSSSSNLEDTVNSKEGMEDLRQASRDRVDIQDNQAQAMALLLLHATEHSPMLLRLAEAPTFWMLFLLNPGQCMYYGIGQY